jgi:hypothetical protein
LPRRFATEAGAAARSPSQNGIFAILVLVNLSSRDPRCGLAMECRSKQPSQEVS